MSSPVWWEAATNVILPWPQKLKRENKTTEFLTLEASCASSSSLPIKQLAINDIVAISKYVTRCWAFVVWAWVSANQKIPCLFWHETHTEDLHARFPTRPEEDEGRKVRESTEVDRIDQLTEESRSYNLWTKICVRGWVSVPCGFVGISLEYTLAHRCTESYAKVSQTSPFLRLELNQVRVFVYSLFSHPVGCILCVRKEMWNTPGRRWEKPLNDQMAMSGLGSWDSGGRLAVYCHSIRNKAVQKTSQTMK